MKTSFILPLALLCAAALANPADPQISNFNVTQDAARVVRVTYSLDEAAVVTMDVLTNGVSIGGANVQNLVGDVNKLLPAGNHAIEWYARRSWPDLRLDTPPVVSVELTAWATNAPPDVMDIDLQTKVIAYYPSIDFLPDGGLANDKYRTTHLLMKKVHAANQTFTMGSPTDENQWRGSNEVQHDVKFTKDYYLAIYETTRKQFALFGCQERSDVTWPNPYGSDDPLQCPVVYITYNKLRGSVSDGIDWPTTGTAVGGFLATIRTATGLDLDIPTEAQWEFACRAGTTTALYSGKGNTAHYSNSDVAEIAWYPYNSTLVNSAGTEFHAVGGKPANPWGFYDMYGNALEWVLDWVGDYDTSVSPAVDPQGSTTGTSRVHRGGSFKTFAPRIRSASRGSNKPQDGVEEHGFRLCLPLD